MVKAVKDVYGVEWVESQPGVLVPSPAVAEYNRMVEDRQRSEAYMRQLNQYYKEKDDRRIERENRIRNPPKWKCYSP